MQVIPHHLHNWYLRADSGSYQDHGLHRSSDLFRNGNHFPAGSHLKDTCDCSDGKGSKCDRSSGNGKSKTI